MTESKPKRSIADYLTPNLGKAIRSVARLRGGGGSALPGKIVETFDPNFMARTLSQLPRGVLLVSGTNGKTTTTRMIAKALENLGLKVFTNPTGSNFTRGVVSALIPLVDARGHLDADIAVLELDEAYAVRFVEKVKPKYALLLNVMRDQLDRFGEIDTTARLLAHVAQATTDTLVLNREDRRIAVLADQTQAESVRYFGLEPVLLPDFPTDDDLHADNSAGPAGSTDPDPAESADPADLPADVTLAAVQGQSARFIVDGTPHDATLKVSGVYNLFNAAAALSVVRAILPDTSTDDILTALSSVTPAFGRGETIDVDGTTVELVLVKNPSGFRLALTSFDPAQADTMVAINDQYADGRDMSWLWDVDFASLRAKGVEMVSGVRSWDMALRLGYDDVAVRQVEPDISAALDAFIALNPGTRKRIYCTYTAMLDVRKHLGELTALTEPGV